MTFPTRPRWAPSSFQQAQDDIEHRPPGESHYVEFKCKLMPTESIRKSLSSMSVDGGTIIYGIEEDKQTRVASGINRVRLNGVAERIQQIAASLDPVLAIEEPLALADPADPESGIIVVHVPASPMAPHQADGRYYRRAGTVSEIMSDAEVERLIKQRNATGESAIELFPTVEGLWPTDTQSIWAAAVPHPVRNPHLLSDALTGNSNASKWISERLHDADQALAVLIDGSKLSADIQMPGLAGRFHRARLSRRTGTVVLHDESPGMTNTFTSQITDPEINRLEISESAGVGLFANNLSTQRFTEEGAFNFKWRDATGLVYALALLANGLASNVGYRADIDVALMISSLEGAYPEEPADGQIGGRLGARAADRDPITDVTYKAETTWSFAELSTGSIEPMRRLFGPLFRSMGFQDYLERLGSRDLDPS